jgi:hypothetical protein
MSMGASPYPSQPAGASGRAVTALVLGIVAFFCCHLTGPVAWILGAQERKAIRLGQSPATGDGYALAGMILGIVATAILAFGLIMAVIWLVAMGGFAILAAAAQH